MHVVTLGGDLSEEVALGQGLHSDKDPVMGNPGWGERSGRGNSLCKGPEVGRSLGNSRGGGQRGWGAVTGDRADEDRKEAGARAGRASARVLNLYRFSDL